MRRKKTLHEAEMYKKMMTHFARIRLSGKKLRKCLEWLKKPSYQFIAPTFHEQGTLTSD